MSTIQQTCLFDIPRDTPAEQPHFGSAGASHSSAVDSQCAAAIGKVVVRSFASMLLPCSAVLGMPIRQFVGPLVLPLAWVLLSTPLIAQNSAEATPPASIGPSTTTADGLAMVAAIESAVVDAVDRCGQSVVAICRVRNDQASRAQIDTLRFGPGLQLTDDPTSEDFVPKFFGSGVIVSADGFIVTCAHVLDDPKRHKYYVWLDHQCYTAAVVAKVAKTMAADPFSDLAILKIEAEDLKPISFSNEPAKKGQFVLALGNPYSIARDGEASASWGMVSNTNRLAPKESEGTGTENLHQLGTLIHTDLRLPIGSSGGALINIKGELLGLTTTLVAGRGFEQSAGFAIAADAFFQQVVETLKAGKQPEYGFLGIQPENLRGLDKDRGLSGARVSMVIPGLPGSLAGLREGDVISKVDEATIRNRNDLFRELSKITSGQKTKLIVQRMRPTGPAQELTIEAELTKKFLATNRASYSLHGPPVWRGAQVEYQSAIAGELERISTARGPKVAFLSVTPDSAIWKAGIRAGFGVVSLNGQIIDTPQRFHELAGQCTGDVALVVISTNGREQRLNVKDDPLEN